MISRNSSIGTLAVILLVTSVSLKVLARMWANKILGGYEALHETLDVDRGEVFLAFDGWTRYKLDSSSEWGALVPGDGLVHLGPSKEPYTTSMMHQLRCLDDIRDQLTRPKVDRDVHLTNHCMNYLRQIIMCHGDTHLDPILYTSDTKTVEDHPTRRCLDWRAVYDRVSRLQDDSMRMV